MTVQLILGDSAQVLKTLPAGSIDLTVTSPPYDNLRLYRGNYKFDFETIAQELYRVTKPGGVVVWVVGDATINGSETGTSFRQALYFMGIGFNCETMIYQAAGTGAKGSNYYYWQSFEYMFVFGKGQPKTSNRISDVKNTSAGKPRGFRAKSARLGSRVDRPDVIAPDYSIRPNVWRYAVGCDDTGDHPAPFPEALARDHILSWSNPGDTVLDPFLGSGTTLKMAVLYDRHGIGIELEPEYMAIAEKRIHDAEQQMRLF
jgi:DNA modification methylase